MKKLNFFFTAKMLILILFISGFSVLKFKKPTSSETALLNGAPSNGTGYASIEAQIDQLAQNAINSAKIPGMTLAVSKDGRLVFNKAYGYSDYASKKQMFPYLRTRIGSVSKVITGLGIMKLTEENPAFTLNKKVYGANGVFKDWKDYDTQNAIGSPAWYAKIQMKHLLSHAAGFKRSGDADGTAEALDIEEEDVTYKQIHQHFLKDIGLQFEPGMDAAYSNHGLGFCGHILSEVSGKPYHTYIINKILKPLDLEGRVVPYSISIDKYMSECHKINAEGKIEKIPHKPTDKVSNGLAAGGWAATARDMVRIMVATDKLLNYPDILKPATIDLMETKPFPNISGHAIAWGMQPKGNGKKLAHGGKVGGGTARIVKYTQGYKSNENIDLSNINLAVCTNGDVGSGALGDLLDEVAKVIGNAKIPSHYDLFQTNIYDVLPPNGMTFTGVFIQKENPTILRICESWSNFTEIWSDFGKKGLRLIDVEAEKVNGNLQYAGIWEKGIGKHALFQLNSWDDFTKKWKDLGDKNYRLIDIERLDGGAYVGVWGEGNGKHALYQYGSWDDFAQRSKDLNNNGYRLLDIEAYDAGDKTHYIGVWGEGTYQNALYSYDNWEDFKAKAGELSADNYRLIDFEKVKSNGKTRYLGIWKAGSGGHGFWHNTDWNSFLNKQEALAKENIHLIDFEMHE